MSYNLWSWIKQYIIYLIRCIGNSYLFFHNSISFYRLNLFMYISIHMSLILWRKDSKCNTQWNFPERKVSVSCCHLEQDTGNRWSCDYSPHRERKCSNSYVYCYRCVIATIQYCNPEIRDTHVHMHNVHTNIFT